ncbi:MAG: hypothetical protein Ct9H90mP9_3510 [Pseudomonadota bacterium]|nr:MAG: hypothetical protein Ct9H90mP9_3510 [Pseudomonadota bacterium]
MLKILGTLGTVSTLQWYDSKRKKGNSESESHGSGSREKPYFGFRETLVISGTESRELFPGNFKVSNRFSTSA